MFRNTYEIINAYELEEKNSIGSWRIPLEPAASEQLWHEALDYYENLDDENECYWFKYYIALNEYLPLSVIERLAKDPKEGIRARIADRKDLTEELCFKLFNDQSEDVVRSIADNGLLPLNLVKECAKSDSIEVRYSVTYNENLPLDLLKELTNDSHKSVRKNAKEIYARRILQSEAESG